jgi:two-component system cell cycle response regulator
MSARILIVDDTPLNVKLLAAKLTLEYYDIVTAENGAQALEKTAKEKPDLILLDVMMPVMDGFETCQRLKADPATAHIPVIILTALTDVADRVRGLAAGADDFLAKPINDIALMARIRSLLRMKILMDEWRLREETAQQLGSGSGANTEPPDIRDSNILVIDDHDDNAAMITGALTPMAAHVTHVKNSAEADAALIDHAYDLIFINLDLTSEDALQICSRRRTNAATRHIPILMLANPSDTQRVAKGLDLGANDYLMQPFDTSELFARSRTQLRHKRNYDRLRLGFERNMMAALVDPLTGCYNRRYLDGHWPRFLQHAETVMKPVSVQMLDIDHFKKVNDAHGHPAGDAVLKEVAQRILNGVRPSDLVVRMGGEEFAVVMPETEMPNAAKIADRLRQSVADRPIPLPGGDELRVTISIGVAATKPHEADKPNDVFTRADSALYEAKKNGRNRVVADENKAK